jgi:hypothetical protein
VGTVLAKALLVCFHAELPKLTFIMICDHGSIPGIWKLMLVGSKEGM